MLKFIAGELIVFPVKTVQNMIWLKFHLVSADPMQVLVKGCCYVLQFSV